MEEVGGDFYDYIPVTDKILGLAIADVSGHGLPAALQVRDIYMGLRMGLARDFKIVRTVERMNQIIHQSTLTSRFVSMFYGELELNGVFIYVNAGHPPPFHLARRRRRCASSRRAGRCSGRSPDATYERGFVIMKPGRHAGASTPTASSRRAAAARTASSRSTASSACSRRPRAPRPSPPSRSSTPSSRSVETFDGETPQEDDRTVMVVRYPRATSRTVTMAFPRPVLP